MYHLINLAAAAQPGTTGGDLLGTLTNRLTPVIGLVALIAGFVVGCVIWFSKEKRSVSKAADTAGSFAIGAVPIAIGASMVLIIGFIGWIVTYATGN